ncbi:hypothetical protein jhhlp_003396 [Lomentospora prolificans]|uniref:Uncharacterized protein n=1 Tax=Lomentospora prolificans TaxID=41688 RepID=A0A2N3N8R0_9PEZI|nr:hypothetical protein jhhlp_003396 [Lomentospora prolificans]
MSLPTASPASSTDSEPILTPASTAPNTIPTSTAPPISAPRAASNLQTPGSSNPRPLHEGPLLNPPSSLSSSLLSIHRLLIPLPSVPAPPTRSVTLILRDMGGVAYTTSTDLDVDHKEIHLSLSYVAGVKPRERVGREIEGVLAHELVHCYQYNGKGKCPGGLIEGIADWVRLRCELAPPHWKRDETKSERKSKRWDRGYDCTAYFLDHLEETFGRGTVARINGRLRTAEYDEGEFWPGLFEASVEELWEDYCCAGAGDDDE